MKSLFLLITSLSLFFACGSDSNAKENSPSNEDLTVIKAETIEVEKTNPELIEEVSQEEEEIIENSTPENREVIAAEDGDSKVESTTTTEEKTPSSTPSVEKKEEVITEETQTETIPEPVQVKAEIHKTWDNLVRKHISSSGKVNYAGFVKDKAELEKYIKELQSYYKNVSSWGRNKRLAYWINVYNAVTVKLITDNYPVKSITDLKGGKPWDAKLIQLGGVSYTLNVIENKIIRPKFNEPRIHFAVNCAAKSCPKILNRAWTEDNLQRYLTKQTKAFLANSSQNTLEADKVKLSKIFDWYKADFGTTNEKVIQFINKYSSTPVNKTATVSYNEYDWSLNK